MKDVFAVCCGYEFETLDDYWEHIEQSHPKKDKV